MQEWTLDLYTKVVLRQLKYSGHSLLPGKAKKNYLACYADLFGLLFCRVLASVLSTEIVKVSVGLFIFMSMSLPLTVVCFVCILIHFVPCS